jgi:hypothetical protein
LAGLDEDWCVIVRIVDHEVDIQARPGNLSDARYHRRTDGEIGHKMAVHDVQMQHGSTAAFYALDLLGQAGKVCGQNRGNNLSHFEL